LKSFLAFAALTVVAMAVAVGQARRPDPPASPPLIMADKITNLGEKGRREILFEGHAQVTLDGFHISADRITAYESTGRVVAEGGVAVRSGSSRFNAVRVEWELPAGWKWPPK
jgi:lipopolysaccharide assembly outer membrane protein LptD (OstA)